MIIDTHMHVGISTGQYNYSIYNVDYKKLLKVMDQLDIRISINSIIKDDLKCGTEQAIKAYKDSGGRIISNYYYNPRTPRQSIEIMDEYNDRKIFRGIKIHPSVSLTSADDERYRPVWEYARKNNLLILSHTWDLSATNPKQKYSYPPLFEPYIKEYPDVTLIMGHAGGRYQGIIEAVKLGLKYPNIYYDIAGDIHINNLLEYLCSTVGSERVLFGSDYTMMDHRTMIGAVLGADIPLSDKENILYKNAMRLYKIE